MTQSIATRAALLTRLNARTEVFIAKLEDETRVRGVTDGPDADLRSPVIPGLYLLDLSFIFRVPTSPAASNGLIMAFTGPDGVGGTGPLGITDGGYGAFAAVGTPQRNTFLTGLNTAQINAVGLAFINQNIYFNRSGWFAVRAAGDLVFNWTALGIGQACTLQLGSSIHLVRALNDDDPA